MTQIKQFPAIEIPVVVDHRVNITVNGETIAEQAIGAEMQYHPAASKEQAFHSAARALVVRTLLLQRAEQLGIAVDSDSDSSEPDEAIIEQLIAREVQTPDADEAACLQYYAHNPEKFKTSALVEASHILIPAAPDDVKARRKARQLADDLLQQLQQDGDFAELAKSYSACPSSAEGGRLGQLDRGQTVAEFERQVFALSALGIAEKPVESRYGFHIVRIDQRAEGKSLEYDVVKTKIADYLQTRVKHKALSQYIEFLGSEADIKGFDLAVADTPLLQ